MIKIVLKWHENFGIKYSELSNGVFRNKRENIG